MSTKPAAAGAVTETAAAGLRAGLDGLLREHVALTAFVVQNLVTKGSLDDSQVQASIGTLQQNTNDLGDAIGQLYGDSAKKQFLDLWNAHIGFFVTYIKGDLTHNAALKAKANKQLDGYRTDFGAFIASANPNLPADAVAAELKPHVQTLFAAIDSVVAGKTNAFSKLKKAADHMPMTAKILAGGIAKQYPDKFPGNSDSGASELRSGLTGLLEEHVYLAGIAVTQGVGEGLTSPQFKAAAGTLDTNSKGLSKAIASVYGDAAGKQFLALWRKHNGFFVT
jgi:hypothetical protein